MTGCVGVAARLAATEVGTGFSRSVARAKGFAIALAVLAAPLSGCTTDQTVTGSIDKPAEKPAAEKVDAKQRQCLVRAMYFEFEPFQHGRNARRGLGGDEPGQVA